MENLPKFNIPFNCKLNNTMKWSFKASLIWSKTSNRTLIHWTWWVFLKITLLEVRVFKVETASQLQVSVKHRILPFHQNLNKHTKNQGFTLKMQIKLIKDEITPQIFKARKEWAPEMNQTRKTSLDIRMFLKENQMTKTQSTFIKKLLKKFKSTKEITSYSMNTNPQILKAKISLTRLKR